MLSNRDPLDQFSRDLLLSTIIRSCGWGTCSNRTENRRKWSGWLGNDVVSSRCGYAIDSGAIDAECLGDFPISRAASLPGHTPW